MLRGNLRAQCSLLWVWVSSIYHEGRRPRGVVLPFVMKVQFGINRVTSNVVRQPFLKMRAELCGQESSLWQEKEMAFK